MSKLTEMMLQIMDAKIAEEHVARLRSKLHGWVHQMGFLQGGVVFTLVTRGRSFDAGVKI